MVKGQLVERLISEGAELLRQLDRRDFPVDSMLWVHLPEEGYWRLVIASPLVQKQGGAAGYRLLNEVLRSINLAGVKLEDISLFEPDSAQLRSFRSLAAQSSTLTTGPEWIEYEDAIVYRWTAESLSADLSCDVSADELTRFWEDEGKPPLNQPKLIIAVDKRRVTLRFHPQHGPLTGVKNLKQPFQIALHKDSRYRNCKVTWLDS